MTSKQEPVESFQVNDPKAAWDKFDSAMRKIVTVPKSVADKRMEQAKDDQVTTRQSKAL